jgi:L-ascorbate metabolism protein UlaG (beta-lactamase superfamily)
MDQVVERQALIDQRRDKMLARYPSLWDKLIAEWNSSGSGDRAWLMYSANYLFRTNDVRWAMDPLLLKSRLSQAPGMVDAARDLRDLEFVILTHRHKDHLDSGLVRALHHLPIHWVVPEAMLPQVQGEMGLSPEKILVPKLLQPIVLNGLRITAFDGLHWENSPACPSARRGVPAAGFLVEQGGKRWLFPGDTRSYDLSGIPDLGPVDVLFVHLWLGRASANQSPPPLLERFCEFCLAMKPRRIILTHMEEWGRKAVDFWDLEHAGQVVAVLNRLAPSLPVEVARMGDSISLV